ncbi:hypothetical protein CY35_11G022500 [Sphagnum magellanicum]|nr:hypothetical protein CY35_11G022500 [Sphagnum magellanicum]
MAEEPLRTAADGRSSQLEGGKPEEDDGNHKTLLQKVEGKFADMEHRMKSKKESSGSKDLDPLLDPLDNLRPAAGTGDTCNSNRRTAEEHHGRLPGKVNGNEDSSSAANPAGTTHGTIEDDSDVASEVESGRLQYKSMW